MRPRLALFLTLAVMLLAPPARANMARAVFEGERWAVLSPENATKVRVDGETLDFLLAPDLATATVLASYRMTNGGDAAESADIAFAYVRGERDGDSTPKATVQADGANVPFRAVTDAELLLPTLTAGPTAHPEIDQQLAATVAKGDAVGGDRALSEPVRAAGGSCFDDCRHLVMWYRTIKGPADEDDRPSKRAEEDRVYEAAREAIPREVDALIKAFSTDHGMPRLGFVLFRADFAPHQKRAITVRYEQRATLDRAKHVNDTYRFDYLLSPASRWASFGALDVSVRVPADASFSSALAFRGEGDTYHASLPSLPAGELRFEVTSRRGLWFGWDKYDAYWFLCLAVAAITSIGLGAATGRLWPLRSLYERLLLRFFVGGALAGVVTLAAVVLLAAAMPTHALGFGYGAAIGIFMLIGASLPVGAIASLVAGAIRDRKT
jgi:hypothetical protein